MMMILFFFCAYSFSCGRVLNVHILSDAGRPWWWQCSRSARQVGWPMKCSKLAVLDLFALNYLLRFPLSPFEFSWSNPAPLLLFVRRVLPEFWCFPACHLLNKRLWPHLSSHQGGPLRLDAGGRCGAVPLRRPGREGRQPGWLLEELAGLPVGPAGWDGGNNDEGSQLESTSKPVVSFFFSRKVGLRDFKGVDWVVPRIPWIPRWSAVLLAGSWAELDADLCRTGPAGSGEVPHGGQSWR